jgi:activator of HSP90 ATPase
MTTRPILQSAHFSAPPEELFEMYLDSKKHSQATGGAAKISRKAGGKFTAFGGQLSGRNLVIVPNRVIVQAWRAEHWPKSDPDSILILTFSKAPGGGQVDLVHVNVPGHDHQGVKLGWSQYYWRPWKRYLARKARG